MENKIFNEDNDGFVSASEFMNKNPEKNKKVKFEYKSEKFSFESYITKHQWIIIAVLTGIIVFGLLLSAVTEKSGWKVAAVGVVFDLIAVYLIIKCKSLGEKIVVMFLTVFGVLMTFSGVMNIVGIYVQLNYFWPAELMIGLFMIYIGVSHAISSLKKEKEKRQLPMVTVDAKVVRFDRANDNGVVKYAAVFEYSYNGFTYTAVDNQYLDESYYREGDKLKLNINKNKPEQIYYKNAQKHNTGVVIGCAFVIAGVYMAVRAGISLMDVRNLFM